MVIKRKAEISIVHAEEGGEGEARARGTTKEGR